MIAAAIFSSLESALYTLVYLYVSSHILNLVVTGLNQRKAVFIISPHWEEISGGILREIRRGGNNHPRSGRIFGPRGTDPLHHHHLPRVSPAQADDPPGRSRCLCCGHGYHRGDGTSHRDPTPLVRFLKTQFLCRYHTASAQSGLQTPISVQKLRQSWIPSQ